MSSVTGPGNLKARAGSPLVSGRASPSNVRVRQHDEDEHIKKDKGFRRYASAVERVLASFETSIEEWADYISFLARLHRTLSAQPAGSTDIPHKGLVAKRLSQCLSPVLPSGVHQKALEVYAYIFQTSGKDGLAADLSLYLPGLSPLLSFAALSVKPNVLSLYEKHIVSLSSIALRPALKALILTILPGLEEENSEEFERCLQLLDRLKNSVTHYENGDKPEAKAPTDQFFWQCLFLACVTSASRRSGVLAYLTRRLPNLGGPPPNASNAGEDSSNHPQQLNGDGSQLDDGIASVASPEPGLLVRCFCAGLRDDQILVQRGFLDLLVTHLPLHSIVLQEHASTNDLKRLVAAATAVVARRDMSLNRRLWSWFLGPEPILDPTTAAVLSPTTPQSTTAFTPRNEGITIQIRYFEQHGLASLTGSLQDMIAAQQKNASERARPLRVCLSLMDKWDIGGLVVPQIFLSALRSAWAYQSIAPSKDAQVEVTRSANMFFDAVESGLIWSEIYKLLANALKITDETVATSSEKLEFILFIVTKFNIREEEMQVVHIPIVGLYALLQLPLWAEYSSRTLSKDANAVIALTLRILLKLVELIPARALKRPDLPSDGDNQISEQASDEQSILMEISSLYTKSSGNIDTKQPLTDYDIGRSLLWASVRTTVDLLQKCLGQQTQIELSISLLGLLLRKGPRKSSNIDELLVSLQAQDDSQSTTTSEEHVFSTALSRISVLETLLTNPHSVGWVASRSLRKTIPYLTEHMWSGLHPSKLKHNVEAARGIWKLQSASPDSYLVESTIVTLMTTAETWPSDDTQHLREAQCFDVLWMHSPVTSAGSEYRRASMPRTKLEHLKPGTYKSELFLLERPLMLLLDSLEDGKGSLFLFVVNWLQSLPSLVPVFKVLFARLATLHQDATGSDPMSANPATELNEYADLSTYMYYLQKVLHIVQIPSPNTWSSLARPNTMRKSDDESEESYFDFVVSLCLLILKFEVGGDSEQQSLLLRLKQSALSLLEQCVLSLLGEKLRSKEIDKCLLEELQRAVEVGEHSLQIAIMDVLFSTLKIATSRDSFAPPAPVPEPEAKQDSSRPGSQAQSAPDTPKFVQSHTNHLPSSLLDCLVLGIKSISTRPILEHWIAFLGHCLPLYQQAVFQVLLSLVSCFCSTLDSVLADVKDTFSASQSEDSPVSEPTIALLLNGLEQTLATAHDQLTTDEARGAPVKVAEPQQSSFLSGMVPGVFGADVIRSKTAAGNRRLTVLLCFKDAIRMAFKLWSWGDSSKDTSLRDMSASHSFSYVTLRLRNRTRRLFEHLFAVEPLECLETLVESWQTFSRDENTAAAAGVLNLVNALESSKPKNAIPAIFNAIYSRTNPSALEPSRKSTLTSEISDISFAAFLVSYSRSLDDDAMDEIWTDCVTFLRDVLANPMPHRQVLAKLLEFTSVLGRKADNTSFGEQRRMRRELGDLFNRLLTAALTIRPLASSGDERAPAEPTNARGSLDTRPVLGAESLVSVLATITPDLPKILVETDRLVSTTAIISNQVVQPIIRARAFPENVNRRTLELLKALSAITEASKPFKRDVGEALNDPKFFSTSFDLVKDGWLPILRSWVLADKERMPELLSRLTYPSTAGLFGVGASSARLEADRKTQLNLRRIGLLILASAKDTFVAQLTPLQAKLIDLLSTTADSSPSTRTRAEVYMVLRALILRTSTVHLSSLWPSLNTELVDALSSAYPSIKDDEDDNPLPPPCLLHACKLLDLLVALGLDDFQLQQWLFIADTPDAVYRSAAYNSVALADDLAEALDAGQTAAAATASGGHPLSSDASEGKRKPLLAASFVRELAAEHMLDRAVRPFLRQLSIQAFESTYGLLTVDEDVCVQDLLADLFAEGTVA